MTLNTSSYYDAGYVDGMRDAGNSVATGKAHIEYEYHKHVDNKGNVSTATQSSTRGGCYTVAHKHIVYCNGTFVSDGWDGYYNWIKCNRCGYRKSTDWGHAGETCKADKWDGTYYYTLGCGKTTSTIVGGTIVYD